MVNGTSTVPVAGAGNSFTSTITPASDGPVTVSLAANVAQDADTNGNTLSNVLNASFDGTVPTASIAAFTGPLNGDQTAVITLSETSTDFVVGDLTLGNATATLTGSGTNYTAVLTPIADGSVTLSVGTNTFSDAAGNFNTAASNEVTTTFDGTSPTITIASTTTTVSGATSVDVTITASEDLIGFAAGDITVVNGSVTTLAGTGAAYVATIGLTGTGNTEVSIPAAVAMDAAGNENEASNTLNISSATVEETQKIIAQFQQSRANQLVSNQPSLTGFLSGDISGAFGADVTKGFGTFNFASPPSDDHTFWFRLSGSFTEEGTRETDYIFGAFGSHLEVTPNLLIGGLIEFDYLNQEDGTSTIDGTGWLVRILWRVAQIIHYSLKDGYFTVRHPMISRPLIRTLTALIPSVF